MSTSPSRDRHGGSRDMVFCHACDNEWYQDEHGLKCPRCDSEATEIITPENDPREPSGYGVPNPHMFHQRPDSDSDPEEADIEEHIHRGPGGVYMRRTFYRSPSQHREDTPGGPGAGRRPVDPTDGDAILQRFTEMLMNDFQAGRHGRSGPDTLFPPENDGMPFSGGAPRHFHRTTYTSPFGGGTASFTIATGPMPVRGPGGPGGPGASGSGPADFNSVFGNLMGGIQPPPPRDANNPDAQLPPGFPATLHQILASILNPASAVHGDAVYSQEALDRIITGLMEANPQSNAAPPASQAALEKLEHKKVDEKMLGAEGKAECTICISEVEKGEDVVALPCKHWFHDECVVMWLKEHNTCPVCRNPIEGGNNSNPQPGSARPDMSRSAATSPGPPGGQSIFGGNPYRRRDRSERNARGPNENEERLNSIINLAGGNNYRSQSSRDRDNRRSSHSPPAPRAHGTSEQPSRMRQRSPSPGSQRAAPSGRDRERSDQDSHRNGQSGHGLFGFLRDRFSGNSGNGSSSSRRRS